VRMRRVYRRGGEGMEEDLPRVELRGFSVGDVKVEVFREMSDLTPARYVDFLAFGEDMVESRYFYNVIARAGRVLGVKSGGGVVGVMQFLYPVEPQDGLFVKRLGILEEFRNMGLSQKFWKALEGESREHGYESLWATVNPWNGSIINSIVNKGGYAGVEVHRDLFGVGEHRFVVERRLGASLHGLDEEDVGRQIRGGVVKVVGREEILKSDMVAVEPHDIDSIERVMDQGYKLRLIVRPKYSGREGNQNLLVFVKGRERREPIGAAKVLLPKTVGGHAVSLLSGTEECMEAAVLGVQNSQTEPTIFSMKMFAKAGALLGVRNGGRIVGAEGLLFNPAGGAFVYGPVLDESHRDAKLALELVKIAEGIAAKRGSASVNSIVSVKDARLIEAYKSAGFLAAETIKAGMDDGSDAVVVSKRLK